MRTKNVLLLFSCLLIAVAAHAQPTWNLGGNETLNRTTDFLGSTNNLPLIFKTNGRIAGYTGYSGNTNVSFGWSYVATPMGSGNTAFGAQALYNGGTENIGVGHWAIEYTIGNYNVAVGASIMAHAGGGSYTTAAGYRALHVNAVGANHNTAIGYEAAFNNLTGVGITATGYYTLTANKIGSFNTANGAYALHRNVDKSYNTAVGNEALFENTGNENTAVGWKSLSQNKADYNTAAGSSALLINTNGSLNTALGAGALQTNGVGSNNTAIGTSALHFNDTGAHNTAIGGEALSGNFHGNYNTAIGARALWSVYNISEATPFEGNKIAYNTVIGFEALMGLKGDNTIEGNNNTVVGFKAMWMSPDYSTGKDIAGNDSIIYGLPPHNIGYNNTALGSASGFILGLGLGSSGYNNTAIGAWSRFDPNMQNAVAIGYGAELTANNQVVIGNTDVMSIRGQVGLTTPSDSRIKKNIRQDVPGLSFINQLQPITYNYDKEAIGKLLGIEAGKTETDVADKITTRNAEEQKIYTGFIAQDVEKAAESVGYRFSGVDNLNSNLYVLKYAEFVVPLVKAVQELSAQKVEKDAVIASLQDRVNELVKELSPVLDGNHSDSKNSSAAFPQ
ncbi:MAG: tail fiber domain-containing protein [Dysgonamonadaceae bacterium]|jgi:hypothetical protein|nr:tail fiber domain-containing protein [Dysgonamonadaceae bacterium]